MAYNIYCVLNTFLNKMTATKKSSFKTPCPKKSVRRFPREDKHNLKPLRTPHFGLLKKQFKRGCALCKQEFTEKKNVCLDHRHSAQGSPFVRGWLCRGCNASEGTTLKTTKSTPNTRLVHVVTKRLTRKNKPIPKDLTRSGVKHFREKGIFVSVVKRRSSRRLQGLEPVPFELVCD